MNEKALLQTVFTIVRLVTEKFKVVFIDCCGSRLL